MNAEVMHEDGRRELLEVDAFENRGGVFAAVAGNRIILLDNVDVKEVSL